MISAREHLERVINFRYARVREELQKKRSECPLCGCVPPWSGARKPTKKRAAKK